MVPTFVSGAYHFREVPKMVKFDVPLCLRDGTKTSHIGLLGAYLRFDHRLEVGVHVAKGLLDEQDRFIGEGLFSSRQSICKGAFLGFLVKFVLLLQAVNVSLIDVHMSKEPMVIQGKPNILELDDGWTIITEDGSLTGHYENTILITEKEPEILTILK